MLPSLGFQEILLLGALALMVVGPKDLPLLLRKIGRFTAKLRGMAQEFRSGFDELARQAELDELKKEVEALRQSATLPDITAEMQRPLGTLESYAGISPPPPPALPEPSSDTASPSTGEAPRSGGGGDGADVSIESSETSSAPLEHTPPQSSLRDDSSPLEGEPREPARTAS